MRSVECDTFKYFYRYAQGFSVSPCMFQQGIVAVVIEVSGRIELKMDVYRYVHFLVF